MLWLIVVQSHLNSNILYNLVLKQQQQQYEETHRKTVQLKNVKQKKINKRKVATQEGTPDSTMQSSKMPERSGPREAIGPLTAPISKWCRGAVDICQETRLHT